MFFLVFYTVGALLFYAGYVFLIPYLAILGLAFWLVGTFIAVIEWRMWKHDRALRRTLKQEEDANTDRMLSRETELKLRQAMTSNVWEA